MSGIRRSSLNNNSRRRHKPTLRSHIDVHLEDDMPVLNEHPEEEIKVPVFFPEKGFLGRNNSSPQFVQIDNKEPDTSYVKEGLYRPYRGKRQDCKDKDRNTSLPLDYNFRSPSIPQNLKDNRKETHSPLMTEYN